MGERLPPFSEESEAGLLGSIILSQGAVLGLCQEVGLTKDALFVRAHSRVYAAMEFMAREGIGIDILTLTNTLRKYGVFDEVGGAAFLDRLVDATPTAAHAEYYIDEVRKHWLARSVLESTQRIEASVYAGEDPYTVLGEHLQNLTTLSEPKAVSHSKEAVIAEIEEEHKRAASGDLPGVPLPFPTFNAFAGGWPFGVPSIIGGREGTRKSFLTMQCALWAGMRCDEPMPGAYFPFEDGAKVAMRRAACMLARVDSHLYIQGRCVDEDTMKVSEQLRRVSSCKLDFIGGRGRNVDEICLEIARGVSRKGWRYVFLDAFKDLYGGGEGEGGGDKYKSRRLFDCAERHNIALITVHHVKKAVTEDSGYDGSDDNQFLSYRNIKGFSEITADARFIVMLQCRAMRAKQGQMIRGIRRGENELVLVDFSADLQKNNHGRLGNQDLELNENTGEFWEKERE